MTAETIQFSKQDSKKKSIGCTICGKPVDEKYTPFCSKRCADVDLNRWLGENYKIPTEEPGIANDPYGEEEGSW